MLRVGAAGHGRAGSVGEPPSWLTVVGWGPGGQHQGTPATPEANGRELTGSAPVFGLRQGRESESGVDLA